MSEQTTNQKFRRMCLELLDTLGHRHSKSNVWSYANTKLTVVYDGGRLVMQDLINHITVWNDLHGGACVPLAPYYKQLQQLMVLDLLADIE